MKWLMYISIILITTTCTWDDQVQPTAYFKYSFAGTDNIWKSGNHTNLNLLKKDSYTGGGFVTKNRLDLNVNEPFDQLHIMFHNFDANELIGGPYWFHSGNEAEKNSVSISFIDKINWSQLYDIYLSDRTDCNDDCKSVFAIGDYFFNSVKVDQSQSFFIIDKINNDANNRLWISGSFQVKLKSRLESSPQLLNGQFHMPLKVQY